MRCVFWLSVGVRELAAMLAVTVALDPKLKRKQLSEQQRAARNNRSLQHEVQTAHASCMGRNRRVVFLGSFWRIYFLPSNKKTANVKGGSHSRGNVRLIEPVSAYSEL